MKRVLPGGYELDDDPDRIDRAAVHRFLSAESYWAAGRPREVMDELIEASRVRRITPNGLRRAGPLLAHRAPTGEAESR